MNVAVFLGVLGGFSIGVTLTTLVLVSMFAKYKRKNDLAEERLASLYQAQEERLVVNSRRVAEMIYDYATGFILSIASSLGKKAFPTQQLVTLSILFSWMYALDTLSDRDKEGAKSIALARIKNFEELARASIEGFSIEVNDFGHSRRFTFDWKGIAHRFTLTPR